MGRCQLVRIDCKTLTYVIHQRRHDHLRVRVARESKTRDSSFFHISPRVSQGKHDNLVSSPRQRPWTYSAVRSFSSRRSGFINVAARLSTSAVHDSSDLWIPRNRSQTVPGSAESFFSSFELFTAASQVTRNCFALLVSTHEPIMQRPERRYVNWKSVALAQRGTRASRALGLVAIRACGW